MNTGHPDGDFVNDHLRLTAAISTLSCTLMTLYLAY